MHPATSALLTDLYQLTMLQAYLDHGQTETAVFEFFVRRFPLAGASLSPLGSNKLSTISRPCDFRGRRWPGFGRAGGFSDSLVDYLATFRFTGDVDAMPEGTVFFANEPILG